MNSKTSYFKKGFPNYLTSHTNPEKMHKYIDVKLENEKLVRRNKKRKK